MFKAYELGPEERAKRGVKGREWALSDEAKMSSLQMSQTIMETLDEGFESFTPRPPYEIHKAGNRPSKYIQHKLTGY